MPSRSLPKPPPRLLRGSLITLRRRCGKSQCRCAGGSPHETPALSYSLKGKTQIQTLAPHCLPQVRKALARYRQAAQELERQSSQAIAWLRHQMGQSKRCLRRTRP
jgi:hypothetical protein